MKIRVRKKLLGTAAVALRTALKYRRNWNKHGPAVKLLQSLMPSDGKTKKGYRLYLDIGTKHKARYSVPAAVRVALKREGFMVTDYLAKKCVKITDKEQKNEFNIGKVIAKDIHAKMAFDNDPQLQNSKTSEFQVVISCHPYDIIGMSTGRDWDKQSCMRLDDGVKNKGDAGMYHRHVKNDVAEGTLVAYAIRADDTNIQKPLVRCLLKPFKNEDGDVLYRRESRVYGNSVPGFSAALATFLRTINAHVPEGFYRMVSGLYNDGAGTSVTHESNTDETGAVLDDDASNLLDFVAHKVDGIKKHPDKAKDFATAIFDGIQGAQTSNLVLPESDLHDIAEMVKGHKDVQEVFVDKLMMYGLDHFTAKIGRMADFFDEYKNPNETVAKTTAKFPSTILLRMAQAGGFPMKVLMEKLNSYGDDEEHDDYRLLQDARKFVTGILTGAYPVPTKEEVQEFPQLASTLFTMASAARFIVLADQQFGGTESRLMIQAHDVTDALAGTPKTVNDFAIGFAHEIGGSTLYAGFLLDNDNSPELDADVVFSRKPYDLARGAFGHRRMFRALNRSKNSNVGYLMDQIKFEIFKNCVSDPHMVQTYKPVYPECREYMVANTEFFHELKWDSRLIVNLASLDASLLKYVSDNGPRSVFGSQLYDTVRRLIPIIDQYKGPKIDVDDNILIETVLRLCVQAGRMMDPVVSLSSKIDIEDISFDDFYDWYSENKQSNMPSLTGVLKYVSYGVRMQQHDTTTPVLKMSHAMNLLVKDAANGDISGFGGFTAEDIITNHRAILKTIKTLPTLENSTEALAAFVESINMDGTEDENEAARNMIDEGHFGVQLNDEDDDYDEQYDAAVEQARLVVEARNSRIVASNSKLLRIATNILSELGGVESDDPDQDLRDFFDHYPEDVLDENMGELQSVSEDVYNHVTDLTDREQEQREIAGYS